MHIETESTNKLREARGVVYGLLGYLLLWAGMALIVFACEEAVKHLLP